MIAERLSEAELTSAAAALQMDEVAVRPRIVAVLGVAGFLELFGVGGQMWIFAASVALVAALLIVQLTKTNQRYRIAVSGLGLSDEEKHALRRELMKDPATKKRIDTAAHGRALDGVKRLARGARRA